MQMPLSAFSLGRIRDIAEGLAEYGNAVYRFDKRTYTYASELAQKKDATHEDEYIVDAVNAVQLVSGQERIDPDRSKLSVTLPYGLNERKKGSR